jgi:hypothetical protein
MNLTPTKDKSRGPVILTHGGKWASETLRAIALGYEPTASIQFETHDPGNPFSGLSTAFDRHKSEAAQVGLVASVVEEEWIARCRFLRTALKTRAIIMLRSMQKAWGEVLDDHEPIAVLSEAIDSYVISTLENACAARGIPFFGFVTSFINGYCRVTRYGELGTFRAVDGNEVAAAHNLLTDIDYQPAFLPDTLSQKKAVLKAWSKNWARFLTSSAKLIKAANRERNHFVGAFHTSRANLHLWPRFDIGDLDWSQRIKKTQRPAIFVPLQFVPEATIDYWCEGVELIKHDNVLADFIGRHQRKFQFVIKEHPNAQGLRTPRLYDRLKKFENVVFAPTMTPVQQVINHVEAVLTWTGTVGFQAALQGKPVFNFCRAYYIAGRFFKVIDLTESAVSITKHIELVSSQPISEAEQMDLVAHTLSGLLPGALRFGHQFRTPSDDETRRYRSIGAALRKLDRINP